MKKPALEEKKLSLKKVQMIKLNNMKNVYGGEDHTNYGNSITRIQQNEMQVQLTFAKNDATIATKPKTLGGGL